MTTPSARLINACGMHAASSCYTLAISTPLPLSSLLVVGCVYCVWLGSFPSPLFALYADSLPCGADADAMMTVAPSGFWNATALQCEVQALRVCVCVRKKKKRAEGWMWANWRGTPTT